MVAAQIYGKCHTTHVPDGFEIEEIEEAARTFRILVPTVSVGTSSSALCAAPLLTTPIPYLSLPRPPEQAMNHT